jgi:hypothetical protein
LWRSGRGIFRFPAQSANSEISSSIVQLREP